ncbi:MAG: beta-propeller fold lactonase family protein [Clostridiales bacterium]|nr:beta-propeller fold lactonase family protein [Clostridiales bacterium]
MMNYLTSGYGTGSQPTIARHCPPHPLWTSSITNPSYLCESDGLLFAVGEFDDHCTVTSFQKDGDSYQEKDTIRLEGTCLCHLDVHPRQHFLACSCWGNGLFFTVSYQPDGTFGEVLYQEYQSDGTGRTSRVHCALILDPMIYVVNIELDLIFCYRLENGIPAEYSRLHLPSGTGPRHIFANREKNLLYCVTEYSSQLLTIDYSNPKEMRLISALPLLDPGFSGTSWGSSLAVTKDFCHLYAANRGENTIAHFLLDENGMPSFADRFSCLGDWPRHIALLDQDRCLGIANQNSGEVVFVERDSETGTLSAEAFHRVVQPGASFVVETV